MVKKVAVRIFKYLGQLTPAGMALDLRRKENIVEVKTWSSPSGITLLTSQSWEVY